MPDATSLSAGFMVVHGNRRLCFGRSESVKEVMLASNLNVNARI